jgi:ankyrin repeat protein
MPGVRLLYLKELRVMRIKFPHVTLLALFVVTLSAQAQVNNSRDLPPRTVRAGILNSKATVLPKPTLPDTDERTGLSGSITVEVIVDEQGDVISAKAVSGPLAFRAVSEQAARKAKFNPTRLSGVPVKLSGIIIYKYKSNALENEFLAASEKGNLARVRALVVRGVDVNTKDDGGVSALMFAVMGNHLPVVKFLLAKGADANAKDDEGGWTALMYVTSPPVAQILTANGADVNAKNKNGETALLIQVIKSERQLPVVQALLAKGADVDARGKLGMTPLLWAAREGDLSIMQALADKGATINARTTDGWTALMFAAYHKHQPVVESLLARGADKTMRNEKGFTALDIALAKRHYNIHRILLLAR